MKKTYVSLEKLGVYDEQIKLYLDAKDQAALKSAKDYADSLAKNYDAAGAAATAEENAKKYTDELATGAVAANTTAIEKLNGSGEGSVAKAVADASATLTDAINAVDEKVGTNTADINTLKGQVDALEKGTYDDGEVRELIAANADAIEDLRETHGTDKQELVDAIAAEKDRAEGIEGGLRNDVDAIKGDYLKAADKTALQGAIDEVAGDVADIVADYLKAADKTELTDAINLKASQEALDQEIADRESAVSGLQTQINTIMNNPDAEGAINSINEFTKYVTDHGEIADGFRTDINKNKEDIAAEVKRAGEAEAALSGRIDALAAIDHDAYIAADTALETASATHALKTEVDDVATALEEYIDAHAGDYTNAQIDAKVKAVADNVAALGDTYATDEELAAAVEAVKTDASNKDAVVLAEAQKATAAVQSVVDTHTANGDIHVTAEQKTTWTTAAGKAHEHGNLSVLEGISDTKVQAWDNAEENAKAHATVLNTAMDTRVVALETWHTNFVEASEQDILDMFKQ